VALCAFFFGSKAARAASFPIKSLPKQASPLKKFCPPRWHFEHQIRTDLNSDAYKDVVIILISDEYTNKDAVPNRDRVLLVLLGCKNNEYRLADYNSKLVLCTTCGGQLGAWISLTPKKHSFEIEQSSGGGPDRFISTYEFAYDSVSMKCTLIRAQQDGNWDRVFCQGTRLTVDFRHDLATINHYKGKNERKAIRHVHLNTFSLKDMEKGKFNLGRLLHVKFDDRPITPSPG